ncbi:hypothetical protein [Streptomyces sp. NPDC049944]|uniref:hypothetical protein n=1 Tax=Streptomyces sp. NPDC049944 TaxID=3155657 RepID=UPI0034437405
MGDVADTTSASPGASCARPGPPAPVVEGEFGYVGGKSLLAGAGNRVFLLDKGSVIALPVF